LSVIGSRRQTDEQGRAGREPVMARGHAIANIERSKGGCNNWPREVEKGGNTCGKGRHAVVAAS